MVAYVKFGSRRFVWDDCKAILNLEKHGIDFDEAASAFDDLRGIMFSDVLHSGEEDRYCLLGCDLKGRLLRVSFCYRDGGLTIRLISARRASRGECYGYYRNWG